ncbi:MAG TPA: cupin domain-containing protein, partial [Gaiellaceae bacterium]|nr:cupin domain-containing protein [Gaiellaceae bacterium]
MRVKSRCEGLESAPQRPKEGAWAKAIRLFATKTSALRRAGNRAPRSRTWTATTRIRPTQTRTTQTRTRTTRTRRALARCIEPVEADRFLDEHWERRPLLVPRDEEGRFDDLLSQAETERLLASTGLRYPAFRIVKAGERLGVGDYTRDIPWRPTAFTGTVDVERAAAEFERGATLVLQALHLHHAPLAEFCRQLESELDHPVQANAYYTPRAAQGLPVHHDTHDVLCLQVAGEKRWLVYAPVLDLPLKDQRYRSELGAAGETVLDVVLRPGDTLYLPRGWLHEALTSETDSLHLTIGVNVYTRLDAVRAALEECAREEVELRRSVSDDELPADDLLELLAARLGPEDVERRRRSRLVDS